MLSEAIERSLEEAQKAFQLGEVPIGAVLVSPDGYIVAAGHNLKETHHDCTLHAEMLVLKQGMDTLKDWRLDGYTLYSTLEPCPMCAGAIIHSRLKKVVYLAKDPKWGACESILNLFQYKQFNHKVELEYLPDKRSVDLLQSFFRALRK